MNDRKGFLFFVSFSRIAFVHQCVLQPAHPVGWLPPTRHPSTVKIAREDSAVKNNRLGHRTPTPPSLYLSDALTFARASCSVRSCPPPPLLRLRLHLNGRQEKLLLFLAFLSGLAGAFVPLYRVYTINGPFSIL